MYYVIVQIMQSRIKGGARDAAAPGTAVLGPTIGGSGKLLWCYSSVRGLHLAQHLGLGPPTGLNAALRLRTIRTTYLQVVLFIGPYKLCTGRTSQCMNHALSVLATLALINSMHRVLVVWIIHRVTVT